MPTWSCFGGGKVTPDFTEGVRGFLPALKKRPSKAKKQEKEHGGPLYLPRPATLGQVDKTNSCLTRPMNAIEMVHSAQKLYLGKLNGNHLFGKVDDEEWRAAFEWLRHALPEAHLHPGIRAAILKMLGSDQTYWFGRKKELFANSLLAVLKEVAKGESALLDEKFAKVAENTGLAKVLDVICANNAHANAHVSGEEAAAGAGMLLPPLSRDGGGGGGGGGGGSVKVRSSVSDDGFAGVVGSDSNDTFGFGTLDDAAADAAAAATALAKPGLAMPLKQGSAMSTLSTAGWSVSVSHNESSLNMAHTAFFRHSKSQLVSGAALVLLGHCIHAKYVEAVFVGADATHTENEAVLRRRSVDSSDGVGGSGGGGSSSSSPPPPPKPKPKPYFHSAPVKSFDRTEQKMMVDYANPVEFPEPDKANYPVDILRSSLVFSSAAAILSFVDRMMKDPGAVHAAFVKVVRIKPATKFLRQVILNVVVSPRIEVLDDDGKKTGKKRRMLYADLPADSRFVAWKDKFVAEGGFHLEGAEALLRTPEIAQTEVRMVAEIQLYHSFFFNHRALTHLWYKVARAPDLQSLARDCELVGNRTEVEERVQGGKVASAMSHPEMAW